MDEHPIDQSSIDTSVVQVPMARLRSVFDGMFDGVWLVAADGRTTYANEAMARLLGSTPAQMSDRPLVDFLDAECRADVEAFLGRCRDHVGERIELAFRRSDGSELVGLVAGSPVFTHEGVFVGTMLSIGDVTGRHSVDAQLVQNQRLEAIGQFAAGIAHDFNNLLTAIHGYAELARSNVAVGDPVGEDLDRVLAGAERASAIARRLLAFTRHQSLVPVDVDPSQVIADLLPILGPLLGDGIDVRLEIAAKHGWIRVDPTQLEQVIVNLVVNARDAMPAGGSVAIRIRDRARPGSKGRDPNGIPGPFVRISVSDTGIGMDEATKARAFEPFYTTKGPGKGTGLGLSTVFGIVAESGGQIWIESAPGKGSTFSVDLPRVRSGYDLSHDLPAEAPARSGVVLLVEDDPAVREFARRGLESMGYSVLATAGADEALLASERWAHKIDVLLTDLVMPGEHGPELAARVRRQRQGIGVVFMSGYSKEAVGPGGEIGLSGVFLPKPFSLEALGRAVARAVEASRAETVQP